MDHVSMMNFSHKTQFEGFSSKRGLAYLVFPEDLPLKAAVGLVG